MSWKVIITSLPMSPAPMPSVNQTIALSYRQGGTTGSFTSFGTSVTVSPTGSIVSPTTLAITGLSDSWDSVEIKAVNSCGTTAYTETFERPDENCPAITDIVATTDWE